MAATASSSSSSQQQQLQQLRAQLQQQERELKGKQTALDGALKGLNDLVRHLNDAHKKADREVKELARTKLGAEDGKANASQQAITALENDAQKLGKEAHKLQQALADWRTARLRTKQLKEQHDKLQGGAAKPR